MGDITSANAVLTLQIATIFPVPQTLQGFAADDVYEIDEIESVETLMGVDGVLSAGWTWKPQQQMITLQADSVSNDIFDQWYQQQRAALTTYQANGVIIIPSLGKKFIQTNGFLTRWKPPGAKRLMQPRRYGITWQQVDPAPV